MKGQELPIKIIAPGRCFRFDAPDATHSPMFHQIEGLVVGKDVTMAQLKGTLDMFVKKLFGENTKTKFRPHNFPFTEPKMCIRDSKKYFHFSKKFFFSIDVSIFIR